jgi:hypothetical protein
MKRVLLFFTLVVAVVALPQFAESQDAAAIQDRLRWLSSFAMSGALYHAQMQALGLAPKAASPTPNRPPDPLPGPFPYASYVATNDNPNQDVEPTVSNVTVGGALYITTAYMSYSSVTTLPLIRSVTTSNSFGTFTPGTLSLPAGFVQDWDPFLASNTGGVVAPGRMYAVGIAVSTGYLGYNAVTAVCVWHSDNGGSLWSNPVILETNVDNPALYLDKPHITVNSSDGDIFVTYLQYDLNNYGVATTHFTRSTDGGYTFATPTMPYSGSIGGPQLAVNTSNSNLYLVWADYGCNCLRVSTSTNNGAFWGTPVSVAPSAGRLIGPMPLPPPPAQVEVPHLANNIRVFTLPMARYNPVANVLGVVWHQREDNGTTNPFPTDTYYSYFNGTAWATPVAVSAIAGSDEFMPALDSDTSGNVSITFYSSYGITGNAQYREWRAFRSFSGAVVTANKALASLWSDPSHYTIYPYFIGDYQDGTSIRGLGYNEYVPAWVGIDAISHGGIYLTDVSY